MKQIFKKLTMVLGWMLIALSLSFCSKETDSLAENDIEKERCEVTDGIPLPDITADFFPILSPTRTVTTTEGEISWDAEDRLTAFVAPTADVGKISDWSQYQCDYITNEDDCKLGLFSPIGEIYFEAGEKDNWYLMSPYSEKVKDPLGGSESTTRFSFDGQVIDPEDPLGHLTEFDIMTATASDIPAGQSPKFHLEHKGALMNFTLRNQGARTVTVNKVEFQTSDGVNIGGTYSIDFSAKGKLTPQQASNKLMVTLKNPKTLAPQESMEFYVIMPPFILASGTQFFVNIHTDSGIMVQKSNLTHDKAFLPGTLNTATVPFSYTSATGVQLDRSEIMLEPGEKYKLTATVLPEGAINKNISWEVENPRIASVDNQGNVTANQGGITTITVRTEDSNHTAECTVHVIGINQTNLVIEADKTYKLEVMNLPEGSEVNWKSEKSEIARVNRIGTVTAVKVGTTKITATIESLGKTFSCVVTVTKKMAPADMIVKVRDLDLKMIKVEGGTFRMGGTEEQGGDRQDSEYPVHNVTLSSYYIGQFEMTQDIWEAVMDNNPSNTSYIGPQYPVNDISWEYIVNDFIPKLNKITGKTFSLPTEAQWEFAARGGNKSQKYKYSGSNDHTEVCWSSETASSQLHKVGELKPNELGIYDMSGNVAELCHDYYFFKYQEYDQTDPTGPTSGDDYRVLRGGHYYNPVQYTRVTDRQENQKYYNSYIAIGFRLVCKE